MNETTANSALLTFAIYLLGVFVLAWLSSRVRRKKEFVGEYFLGGRSLGLWAFALTFAATSSSGGSFMGFPSLVYTHGWVLALWIASYMLVPLVGMGLLGKRVNRLARQSGAVTIPDLIKARFRSESVGMIATLLVLFFMFFYLLAQFKAGSKIMTTLLQDVAIYQSAVNAIGGAIDGLPWIGNAEPDYVLCLLVFAFSVIVYTAFGGFRAVVWTDVMQGIVMGVGVIILLFLTLGQVGGLTKATEQLKEMTPPETGIGIVTLGQAQTETITLPKGGWLRLSDGGIARLAEQASLAKGETRTEAKLLKSVNSGRTVEYRANKQHSLFKDLQSVVKKFVGLDKVAEELAAKLGDIQAAYVIGDYAKGNDSGLIDLVLIGQVDDEKLKEVTKKTEELIDRKIRTLVLAPTDLEKLQSRLDIEHALFIWGNGKVKGDVE